MLSHKLKPYKRTACKKNDMKVNANNDDYNTTILGGNNIANTLTYHSIDDVKPIKRPLKPKEIEPTTKKEKLDYFIQFKFN
jgi:hypothetical protein